jgi:hypothetical protein
LQSDFERPHPLVFLTFEFQVTDASVNGYIANFPKLFYAKVCPIEYCHLFIPAISFVSFAFLTLFSKEAHEYSA